MPPEPRDVLLFLALVALLAAGWWRERRRAARGETELPGAVRALLLLAAVGGGVGAVIWFLLLPGTFAWALPSLASRFLAAAAAAIGLPRALTVWLGRAT